MISYLNVQAMYLVLDNVLRLGYPDSRRTST